MKDDRIYLEHIRDAIGDLQQYAAAGREAFMSERMRQDAVIRKLEIIGEAVKKLSAVAKDRRSEISWKAIAGMRDRLTREPVRTPRTLTRWPPERTRWLP